MYFNSGMRINAKTPRYPVLPFAKLELPYNIGESQIIIAIVSSLSFREIDNLMKDKHLTGIVLPSLAQRLTLTKTVTRMRLESAFLTFFSLYLLHTCMASDRTC
jgi:hypothetical protein